MSTYKEIITALEDSLGAATTLGVIYANADEVEKKEYERDFHKEKVNLLRQLKDLYAEQAKKLAELKYWLTDIADHDEKEHKEEFEPSDCLHMITEKAKWLLQDWELLSDAFSQRLERSEKEADRLQERVFSLSETDLADA